MLFFGSKQIQRPLPGQQKVCPVCLSVTEHTVTENGTYFTIYFIPLFPVKRDVVFTCNRCGESYTVPYAEYQAEHTPAEENGERDTTAENRIGGKVPKSTRDKAKVILEGKVINGKVENLRVPFNISSRQVMLGLWAVLGLIVLLAAILLIVLFTVLSR